MRRILCYGDSNTWGYDAAADDRFPEEVRWTGVLQQLLGEGFRVIEEGQPGRTTVWDDPIEEHRNGKTALYSVLESQSPVDLVVLMLGTNDLKPRFSLNAFDIAAGLERLVRIIQTHLPTAQRRPPEILLVCPPAGGGVGGPGVHRRDVHQHPQCGRLPGAAPAGGEDCPAVWLPLLRRRGCRPAQPGGRRPPDRPGPPEPGRAAGSRHPGLLPGVKP